MVFGLQLSDTQAATGRTPGAFQVSSMGSAQYSISIWAAPGPRGIQPALSLSYDSRSSKGPVGVGWSLAGLGQITRCERTTVQDGYAAPVALTLSDGYCINGQRLRLTSAGNYGQDGSTYATEIFDRTRITAHVAGGVQNGPAYFTVQGPDGTTYYYGYTDANGNGQNSQVLATGTQTVLTWLLSRVADAAGNNYVVNYTTMNGTLKGTALPAQILWVPSSLGASSYQYQMLFSYAQNTAEGSQTSYVANTAVYNNQLLQSIEIRQGSTSVKAYVLSYQTSPVTGRKLLTSIKECRDIAQSDCLAPTTVSYGGSQQGVSSTPSTALPALSANSANLTSKYDMNGDGYADLVYSNPGNTAWYVAFGSANGFGAPLNLGLSASVQAFGDILIGQLTGTATDAILAKNNGTWYAYSWNGSSFSSVNTGIPATAGSQLADINGDGRPDLVMMGSTGSIQARLNTSNASGVSFSSTVTTGSAPCSPSTLCDVLNYSASQSPLLPDQRTGKLRSFDFNGDGVADLAADAGMQFDVPIQTPLGTAYLTTYTRFICELVTVPSANGTTWTAYALTGSTWNAQSQGPPAVSATFADLNDDHCTDAFIPATNTIAIAGCGGNAATTYAFSNTVTGTADWDGDGRADLISGTGISLATGTGMGPLQATGLSSCAYMLVVQANGQDDIACWNGGGTAVQYYPHYGAPDLAVQFQDGYGNQVIPHYVSLAQAVHTVSGSYTGDVPPQIGSLFLVSEVDFSDPGGGAQYSQIHTYSNAGYDWNRGFLGFATHQVHDSRSSLWTTQNYNLAFPLTGMVASMTVALNASASQVLLSSSSNYASQVQTNLQVPYQDVWGVTLQDTHTTQYELGPTPSSATRAVSRTDVTYSYGNSLGIPSGITQTVTDLDAGSPYNGNTWTSATSKTLSIDTAHWCLGLVTQSQISYSTNDGGAPVTRTRQFTPDTVNCRYTQVVTEPSSAAYKVTENLQYDGFGNVASDQFIGVNMGNSPATRQSTVDWGTTGQFPTTVTNPAGAVTHFGYDPAFGVLTSLTDPNGLTTTWALDNFGRKLLEVRADGTRTGWSYNACTAGCPAHAVLQTTATLQAAGTQAVIRDEQSYLDAAERVIEQLSRNQNPGGGGASYTLRSWQYDALGRLVTEGGPALAGTSAPQITYHYDDLGRLTTKVYPANGVTASESHQYAGDLVTQVDANGHSRVLIRDPGGRLRRTRDANGYEITFGYDAAGSQTSVTDNQGHTLSSTTYQYGLDSFRVATTDTDLGTWNYSYNALGELTQWTDAKGQVFSMTYDALSRPVTRYEPDLFTRWTWGTNPLTHEVGQLSQVCTGTGVSPTACNSNGYAESATYDSLGRPQDRTIVLPGEASPFVYSYDYDPQTGLPAHLTYPATGTGYRLKLQYGYAAGLLTSITDVSDTPNVTLWSLGSSANAVDGWGHYLNETLGNGVQVTHQFDPGTGWLNSLSAGPVSGAALQSSSYLHDAVGNLIQRQDAVAGSTENVYMDALDRLNHTVGDSNLQLTYDISGRMGSWTVFGGSANINDYDTPQPSCSYYPDHAQIHAVRQINKNGSKDASACYDPNGNQTEGYRGNGAAYLTATWMSYNQPSVISLGWPTLASPTSTSGTSQFFYDHNHLRWKQIAISSGAQETTEYIGDSLEKVITSSGTSYRHYVPAGNNFVVYIKANDGSRHIYYATRDPIGSTAAIFHDSGALQVQAKYSAAGLTETSAAGAATMSGITRRGFGGADLLGNVLGINFGGRVYHNDGGSLSFFSPDPSVPHPADTRSYNRYAYVRYNPLTYVDPTGFKDCSNITNDATCSPMPNVTVSGCALWSTNLDCLRRVLDSLFGVEQFFDQISRNATLLLTSPPRVGRRWGRNISRKGSNTRRRTRPALLPHVLSIRYR